MLGFFSNQRKSLRAMKYQSAKGFEVRLVDLNDYTTSGEAYAGKYDYEDLDEEQIWSLGNEICSIRKQ